MDGKPGRFTWNDLCIYVLYSGMDGTYAGSRKCKFYDHYGDRSTDRRVWIYEDGGKHF